MDKQLLFNGDWITEYFRRRWVDERDEDVVRDLVALVSNLDRETAVSILSGYKKIQTTIHGCFVVADNATEIDGVLLVDTGE